MKVANHIYSHLCYRLYKLNIATHFLHLEKLSRFNNNQKKKKKEEKQKKNGVQHFFHRSCDQNVGWSSILECICAQGFLHPLLAVNCCCSWYITKLMVIGTTNNVSWNILWLNFISHMFLFFKFWQKNVVYTFPCTNKSISLSWSLLSLTHSLRSFSDFTSTQHIVWLQFYYFLFAKSSKVLCE